MQYEKIGFPADIWSFGCIVGSILFEKRFIFKGKSGEDILNSQAAVIFEFCLHAHLACICNHSNPSISM